MEIKIPPSFLEQTWVQMILLTLSVAAVVFGVRLRQKAIYRRKIEILEHQNAIERERLRISRDMHDEIGSGLTRISILSSIAMNEKDNPARQAGLLKQISGIAGEVVDDMGEIIWAMNPRNDSSDSLISFLRQYAGNFLDSSGIEVAFDIKEDKTPRPISSEFRRNLFLIVKEALNNVVKHSGASLVRVKISAGTNLLYLSISDNGKGMESAVPRSGGNGLNNMRMRAESIGGQLTVSNAAGKGLTITFEGRLPAIKL